MTRPEDLSKTDGVRPRAIDWWAGAALLGCVLCWGSTPVMLRRLTVAVDAWVANGIRYPFAGVLYWPVLVWAGRKGLLTRQTLAACAVPSLLALAGQVLWGLCPYYLSASAIGFFVRMSLVWSTVFAMWLFRDERGLLRHPVFHAGMVASVAGFLGLSWLRGSLDADVTVAGIVLITFCSMLFGGYAVSVRRYLSDVHPIVAFAVVCQMVSAGTLVLMFCFGDASVLPGLSALEWSLMLGSSLLGIGLGHIFMYTGVRRVGASISSGVQTVGPFVTAALAMVFLGERMAAGEWLFGILMVIGATLLFIAQRGLHEPSAEARTPAERTLARGACESHGGRARPRETEGSAPPGAPSSCPESDVVAAARAP